MWEWSWEARGRSGKVREEEEMMGSKKDGGVREMDRKIDG